MATTEPKKKRKRFSLFKTFRFYKRNKEQTSQSCTSFTQGVEPLEINPPIHVGIEPSDRQNTNGGDAALSATPENEMRYDQIQQPLEVSDNIRNEHIEEILLNHDLSTSSSDESGNDTEHLQKPNASNTEETRQDQVLESSIIPTGLYSDMMFVYTHVFIAALLCACNVLLGVLYAWAVLVMSGACQNGVKPIVAKVLSSLEDVGVSWHVVVWILLATFGNMYIAMAYALVIFIYQLCVTIADQIAQTIAQLLASLIYVLFLGPVIALFGAVFNARGVAQPYAAQRQHSNSKASNVIEALLHFFMFPVYLPIMLREYHSNHTANNQIRERPSRDCDVLRRLFNCFKPSKHKTQTSGASSVRQIRERPSRGCDLCRFLFGARKSTSQNISAIDENNQFATLSGNFQTNVQSGRRNIRSSEYRPTGNTSVSGRGNVFHNSRPSRNCDICRRLFR